MEEWGYTALEAESGPGGLAQIRAEVPDLILLDVQMPGLSGFDVVELLERDVAVVFVTAYDQYATKAFELAAMDYVLKPVQVDRLKATVERLRELETTVVGYELVEDARGRRSILTPMAEMAGDLAVFTAAHYLQNEEGGRGILLSHVPGVAPPTVLVLGAGTVGRSAAARALTMGAHVIVLDEDLAKLRSVSAGLGAQVVTELATADRLARYTAIADVVVGAILIPAARAPLLITEDMVRAMRAGSVIIDVSIDQGGCVETSRPTTLENPVLVLHDVVHYCVPNMTANVARTASRALSDVLLRPLQALATKGLDAALREDPGLAAGCYLYRGKLVNEALARALGVPPASLVGLLWSGEKRP